MYPSTRGSARDRRERRARAQARDARARRQVAQRDPPRRRPQGGDPRLVHGPVLQLRSGLQRRVAAAGAQGPLRRRRRRAGRAGGKDRHRPWPGPKTFNGPLISAEQKERVSGYIDAGKDEAELVAGGSTDPIAGSGGYFVEPTLFTTTNDDAKIVREEIFGLVLVAQPYDTLEEVAERANDSEYGLAAGVWTPTSPRPTVSPRCCAPGRSTSTRGAPPTRRPRSAASSHRASAGSTVTPASTATSRTRRCSCSCSGPGGGTRHGRASGRPRARRRDHPRAAARGRGLRATRHLADLPARTDGRLRQARPPAPRDRRGLAARAASSATRRSSGSRAARPRSTTSAAWSSSTSRPRPTRPLG